MATNKHHVGEVRPSQLIWTYGPGALIDLPNLTVLVSGLDKWDTAKCSQILESRLLEAVKRELGPQVKHLMMAPIDMTASSDPFSPQSQVGVPVEVFPKWLRCSRCQLLSEVSTGLFKVKPSPYKPEHTRYVHENCSKGKNSEAVPARFLMACENGHLDDFPWNWFVHGGPSNCKGNLRFYESEASMQPGNLWVKCEACNSSRQLGQAFGKKGQENLPACRGRHPHLGTFDSTCDQAPRSMILGATNTWFSRSLSVLSIPIKTNQLLQLIEDGWDEFKRCKKEDWVELTVERMLDLNSLAGIEAYSLPDIWKAIEEKRNGTEPEVVFDEDIKRPEWDVFTSANPQNNWPHFKATRVKSPQKYSNEFSEVLALERLREVNALIGFTRVQAPDETLGSDVGPEHVSLSNGAPEWVPAGEVHGEGIFIRFDEERVSSWEATPEVIEREKVLNRAYSEYRISRKLDPSVGFPGIRYVMMHTFSHLLIRELALECGYNAASLKERIYSDSDKDPMAGILIYTASADSDGTLGGLVDLSDPQKLGPIIQRALERSKICSADPLCSEHDPIKDRSLHAASCHACSFISETSCEKGNRYLDRSLVVETLELLGTSFFK